ncbi:MAG TPA: hypothetical protein VGI92_11315 [Gemmatimonadales bacterium]
MRRLSGALRLSSLLLPLLTGACALHFNARSLGVPVTMSEPLAQGVAGDSFAVTTKALHVFWGLATAHEPSLKQALAGQLGQGSGVRNLAIHSRKKWDDVLVTVLTLGLVSPTTVTFSGRVTRGPSP